MRPVHTRSRPLQWPLVLISLLLPPTALDSWAATLVDDIEVNGESNANDQDVVGSLTGHHVVAGSRIFFQARTLPTGNELWLSDGTFAGTVLVKDINPGTADGLSTTFGTVSFANTGGEIFFPADDGVNGVELWKTDGTTTGTVLVKDIAPGADDSTPASLTTLGSLVIFMASDPVNGTELWRSDGTAAGTVLIKDINSAGGSSELHSGFTELGGNLFFNLHDGVSGQLWRTDGSEAGTMPVGGVDLQCGSRIGGLLLCSRYDSIQFEPELWTSDGTAAGAVLVKEFPGAYELDRAVDLDGTPVFFVFEYPVGPGASSYGLWKTDGTSAGTVLVRYFDPDASDPGFSPAGVAVGGTFFFRANGGAEGVELWRSDGTTAGTTLVKDIRAGALYGLPNKLVNVNGTLFFTAIDGITGSDNTGGELYKSDGTAAGTVLVKDLRPGPLGSFGRLEQFLANVNGTLFTTVSELHRSDGTAAGTVLVRDLSHGSNPGYNPIDIVPSSIVSANGALYFIAQDGINGGALWKSDGVPGGAVLVKDLNPASIFAYPIAITASGGSISFMRGADLWKSDGTTAGTAIVKAGVIGSPPATIADAAGTLFFAGESATQGRELWKSDGTEAGTVIVKDVCSGASGSSPISFADLNGTLFFNAADTPDFFNICIDDELWKSDGTEAGTVRVKDISPGFCCLGSFCFLCDSRPRLLTNVDGTLFFAATGPSAVRQLWKSDGTESGTVAVKDIEPLAIVAVNDTAFFLASDATNGLELWKSDGTELGTVLVKDIVPGPAGPFDLPDVVGAGRDLVAVGGRLYFNADGGTGHGRELWRSDGTAAGTGLVADIFPGSPSSWPGSFAVLGQNLYFAANDDAYGRELWMLANILTCGDGVADAGEACDDGDLQQDDACKSDCTANVCGDYVVQTGVEDCDDGNVVGGDCCSATCQFEGAGSACPDDGSPCSTDQCDGAGSCVHAAANAGAVCHPSASPCDPQKTCDGVHPLCPFESYAGSTTICRAAAGGCDAPERCHGGVATCPADQLFASGAVCRAASGVCDVAESCAGGTAVCPADAKSSAVCRPSAGVCDVAESCDGVGNACPADVLHPSSVVCRPAASDCDAAESCTGSGAVCPSNVFQPNGTSCSDGSACTTGDTCTGGACTSGPPLPCDPCLEMCEPLVGCTAAVCQPALATKSKLTLKRKSDPAKDSLGWKWTSSAPVTVASFGTPTAGTEYTLCVLDEEGGQPTNQLDAVAPAGGLCAGKPCWSSKPTSHKYKDKELSPDGLSGLDLKAGDTGKGKLQAKGKGANLGMPALPLTLPVTVRLLRKDAPVCWEATYSTPSKNDAEQFNAKSD